MANPDVFAMVLAGGEGKRLAPLTADQAKPAVPFGEDCGWSTSCCRTWSTAVHADLVLTQYKSHSLDRHVTTCGCRRCWGTT